MKYGWREGKDILEKIFISLMSDFYISNDFLRFLVLYSDNGNILWQFVVLFFCKNFGKFENWPGKKVKYDWGEGRDILEGYLYL